MAKYCFANFQKRKRSSVSHLQKEANREWENEEKYKSEVDLETQNIYLKHSENWNEKIDEILEENGLEARSNSVVMTTTIYGFSEEWEDDLKEKYSQEEIDKIKVEYFKKCYEFEQTRGECFNFVIHADEEGNWHAHAATVPVTESFVTKSVPQVDKDGNVKRYTKEGSKSFGKIKYKQEYVKNEDGTIKTQKALSAKAIFGNRKKMSDEQTRFYEECGKAFGMERGEIRLEDKPGAVKHLTEAEFKARQIKDNARRTADDLEERTQAVVDKIKKRTIEKANRILAEAKERAKALTEELDDREIKLTSREKNLEAEKDTVASLKASLEDREVEVSRREEEALRSQNRASEMLEDAQILDEGFVEYAKSRLNPQGAATIDKLAKDYKERQERQNVILQQGEDHKKQYDESRRGNKYNPLLDR